MGRQVTARKNNSNLNDRFPLIRTHMVFCESASVILCLVHCPSALHRLVLLRTLTFLSCCC